MKKAYISPSTYIVILAHNPLLIGASGGGTNDLTNGGRSGGGRSGDAKGFSFEPWDDSFEEE